MEQDRLPLEKWNITVWGAVAFHEGHPSTDNAYRLARVSYQYIPFWEEHRKDLMLELSLVGGKPQLSSNFLKKPS